MGEFYKGQGRYSEAQSLLTQALHIRELVLGSTHPETLKSLKSYKTLLAL